MSTCAALGVLADAGASSPAGATRRCSPGSSAAASSTVIPAIAVGGLNKVLKAGASPTYGSDAVGGVANFEANFVT